MRIINALLLLFASISITKAAYPIPGTFTGYGPATNQRPARQNILTLRANPYQWPLYIRALSEMQAVDPNDLLSYFQVAGIHGRPFVAWDGAINPGAPTNLPYCTHSSPLFGSWHRPYLALYEQILARRVQAIAQQYRGRSDEASWFDAANRFRIPYWDWAETQDFPAFLNNPRIVVQFQNGNRDIENPLFQYKFREPVFPSQPGPGQWYETRRGTTAGINDSIRRFGVRQLTYNSFQNRNYISYIQQTNGGTNIESIHGSIHVAAVQGSNTGGNMISVEFSAFDPIFMLHHCNVDRLVAMWQVLNPTSYIPTTGTSNPYTSFGLNAGSVFPNTPLRPFLRTSNQWWDSNLARSPANFGYTYPEINDWNIPLAQTQANVRAAIIARYGPGGALPRRQENGTDVEYTRSWFATVSCRTNIADKAFFVVLFLGEPPADPAYWFSSDSFVNMMPLLVPTMPGTSRPAGIRTNMEYPLDDALAKAKLEDRSPAGIEKYLADNLTWRIMTHDKIPVPVEDDDRLEIGVYDVEITPPSDPRTEFPIYGPKTPHPRATKGKTGSVN